MVCNGTGTAIDTRRSATLEEITMRCMTSLAAVAVMGAALLTTPGAMAADSTCRGVSATIVGTGADIVGTDGRDVIVTGSSGRVDAGEGDDLICVAGAALSPGWFIDAGLGNDTVDTTGWTESATTSFGITTNLGTGIDTFIGGTAVDTVSAEGVDDQVLLGDGDDDLRIVTSVSATSSVARYDGASGDNSIHVVSELGAVDLELDGVIIIDDTTRARLVGFDNATVEAPQATLRGNDQDNNLRVSGCALRVDGEGGDDLVGAGASESFSFPGSCDPHARLSGGAGNDVMYGWNGRDRLFGDAGDDRIRGRDGRDLLSGGAGDDRLGGGDGADMLRSGRGNDKLVGNPGNDSLDGGHGQDSARGGDGRDRCDAEFTRCER